MTHSRPKIEVIRYLILSILLLASGLNANAAPYADSSRDLRRIESVRVIETPASIEIGFSGKTQVKILSVAASKYRIAFKDTMLSDFPRMIRGTRNGWLESFQFERLPDHVMSLVITTRQKVSGLRAEWRSDARTLVIGANVSKTSLPSQATVPSSKPEKTPAKLTKMSISTPASSPSSSISVPSLPSASSNQTEARMDESIDDILPTLLNDLCWNEAMIRKTAEYCRKKLYNDALTTINGYLGAYVPEHCRVVTHYLKGYILFKRSEGAKEDQFLEAMTALQDAVSFHAKSKYTPFGLSMLGKLCLAMNNDAEAKGYFKIVLDDFSDYSGKPEILYEMGRLFMKEKSYRPAISLFESVIRQYPGSKYEQRVKLELGKAFYETNQYVMALRYFDEVAAAQPEMVYQQSDLLLYMGNSNYRIANYPKTREYLTKAFNLFPKGLDSDTILARVGDAYADEGLIEKAKRVYEEVKAKFPGSDGFIISSLRMAQLEENRETRETIYRNIIKEFPEHPMAGLSRLRLAESQQAAGDFKQSIATVNDLLMDRMPNLRREALYLKEKSFELWFEALAANNNYPQMMQIFEDERPSIIRFQNPRLLYLSGKAFFAGHLYAQAAENLSKAMTSYRSERRPQDLMFFLGAAQQEIGRNEEAMYSLINFFPGSDKSPLRSFAYQYLSKAYFAQKKYSKAEEALSQALQCARDNTDKYEIMLLQAQVAGALGKKNDEIALLENAVNSIKSENATPQTTIASAYRRLGDAYLSMKSYLKAADAFNMAIRSSQSGEGLADLRFYSAEAYQKGKAIDQAAAIYREIVATGDPFWGKLAEEKLRGINIEMRLGRTG